MRLTFTDRNGEKHALDVSPNQTLMRVLRDDPDGVSGICGGVMACGTCHVYVAPEHYDLLPKPSPAEAAMLDGLSSVRPNSRLSCQIFLRAKLADLHVVVAPEE